MDFFSFFFHNVYIEQHYLDRDLNQLVMNYLVVEGYKDAAEQFSSESGLAPTVDLQSIQERMDIRHAIQSGDVDTAIDLVNDLNPEVKKKKKQCKA